jgi:predicted transcriptional regulator
VNCTPGSRKPSTTAVLNVGREPCVERRGRACDNGPVTTVELPDSVRSLLWDVADASWERHRDFLIERVLSQGDWESWQWIRRRAGAAALRAVLERTRARSLSRAQISFWQVILDLPEDLVSAWLANPSRVIWDRRTA